MLLFVNEKRKLNYEIVQRQFQGENEWKNHFSSIINFRFGCHVSKNIRKYKYTNKIIRLTSITIPFGSELRPSLRAVLFLLERKRKIEEVYILFNHCSLYVGQSTGKCGEAAT